MVDINKITKKTKISTLIFFFTVIFFVNIKQTNRNIISPKIEVRESVINKLNNIKIHAKTLKTLKYFFVVHKIMNA